MRECADLAFPQLIAVAARPYKWPYIGPRVPVTAQVNAWVSLGPIQTDRRSRRQNRYLITYIDTLIRKRVKDSSAVAIGLRSTTRLIR